MYKGKVIDMFEFSKLCNEYEKLTTLERGVILSEKSVKILAKLRLLDIPGINPIETLACFIMGSIVADGRVNEQEYLLMYPALIKVFGDDFDFATVKKSIENNYDGNKEIKDYTKDITTIFGYIDDELKADVVGLCLCIVTIDGKISLKEKNYIRRLCRA